MNIIRKYKKVFIAIVIIAAILTSLLAIGMISFMNLGSSFITEVVKNDEELNLAGASVSAIPDRVIQQDFKHDELDFSNGPVVFSLKDEFKDISSGGANFMSAYLEEGDKLDITFKVKRSNGDINFNLYGGQGLMATLNGSGAHKITIDETGNYVFEYYADNFKGNFDITVKVTRP